MKAPPHPADFLNEVLMPATGRSDGEIARLLGISVPVFYTILTREKPITRTTAEMLGRLFHTGVNFWLRMQVEYDRNLASQIVVEAEVGRPDGGSAILSMREHDRSMLRLPKPGHASCRVMQDNDGIDFGAETLPVFEGVFQVESRRTAE
jgi:addiction module HigA family antidote